MSTVTRIAREEWRALTRDRVAVFGFLLLTVLTLVAALNAYEHQRHVSSERARYQEHANHEFEEQPDRHPHRAAHFGHYLFRPLNPLAAFDPGIDSYTGNTLYLEPHRQNSANFGDVRQSSLLLRFGQLTPAFVLQVLAPLLLVFVGHASVARERESGTLRILLAQGVGGGQIVLGKLLALSGFAALALLPALLALGWLAVSGQSGWIPILLLGGGYGLWLLLWSLAVVWLSSLFARGRDALLGLLAVWAVLVILLPRWVPEFANRAVNLPTRFETEIQVKRENLELGNAHNPDDPKFAEFRERILREYGVERVEDLPINFKGLVGEEGERQTSELFNRHIAASFERQMQQNRLVDGFAWLSPTLALRRLSMGTAETDLANYRRFIEQGEAYRYDLIQRLNRIQAEALSYADDTDPNKDSRVDKSYWQTFPEFHYQPMPLADTLRRTAPALLVLLLWLATLTALAVRAARRLGRSAQ